MVKGKTKVEEEAAALQNVMYLAKEESYRYAQKDSPNQSKSREAGTGNFKPRTLTESEVKEWKKEKDTEMRMLREWLAKQRHLPENLTDEQLLIFLHSCMNSVEKTKSKIENHFTIRTHAPEIFASRSLSSYDVTQALGVVRISPLSHATPNASNAIFIDCVDSDVENYNFTAVMKAASMAMDALIRYFPREESNIIVFDMKNSALAHVLKTNLVTLKKAMLFVETSLLFKLSQVHIINASSVVNHIQAMLKPFIHSKLGKLIHIHMQDDMESFYKFIPRKYLPKEYGGEATSLLELNYAMKEMMAEQQSYLEALDKQIVNEDKREAAAKASSQIFGIEGSFRKLEFD